MTQEIPIDFECSHEVKVKAGSDEGTSRTIIFEVEGEKPHEAVFLDGMTVTIRIKGSNVKFFTEYPPRPYSKWGEV